MLKRKVVTAGLLAALMGLGGVAPAIAQPAHAAGSVTASASVNAQDSGEVVLVAAESDVAIKNEVDGTADVSEYYNTEQDGVSYHVYDDHAVLLDAKSVDATEFTVPTTVAGQPVTSIGLGAFQGNTSLQSVTLPEGITTIGYDAFEGCTGLTSVTLPQSLKALGLQSFANCTSLASVRIESTDLAADSYAFQNIAQGSTISVPTYKVAEQLHRWMLAEASYDSSLTTVEVRAEDVTVYRVYNQFTGEHLFTTSTDEYANLTQVGWTGEGEAWKCPSESLAPVYRLYNPFSGDHQYTTSESEYANLASLGWRQEGVAFYSASNRLGKAPRTVYRLYNPWITVGTHLFTVDGTEYNNLVAIGWTGEGEAFYALAD